VETQHDGVTLRVVGQVTPSTNGRARHPSAWAYARARISAPGRLERRVAM